MDARRVDVELMRFVESVRRMRHEQKNCDRRNSFDLQRLNEAEKEVDNCVEALTWRLATAVQPEMFR